MSDTLKRIEKLAESLSIELESIEKKFGSANIKMLEKFRYMKCCANCDRCKIFAVDDEIKKHIFSFKCDFHNRIVHPNDRCLQWGLKDV